MPLYEADTLSKSMFQAMPDAVFIVDAATGRIMDCNPAAEAYAQRTRREIIDLHFTALHPDGKREEYMQLFQRFASEEVDGEIEIEFLTASGETKWAGVKAPVVEMDGRAALLGVFRDISDRKRTEHELRESEARYRTAIECISPECPTSRNAQMVTLPDGRNVFISWHNCAVFDEAGRVVEIQGVGRDITERKRTESALREEEGRGVEEQVRGTRKMEAVGQLAGGVAHELNNHLAVIIGYGELLAGSVRRPEEQEHLQNILSAASNSSELIRKLLAFARKGQFQRTNVDVNQIITEVATLLKASLHPRIEVKEILNADPSVVECDPDQLESALVNLGFNAHDAMPDGGLLVFESGTVVLDTVKSGSLPFDIKPGTYLTVRVHDDGCGMDAEVLERAMEPFFTTKAPGTGSGMGLAAVYGTVTQLGGNVEIQSEAGLGTTVTLYLPVR